MSPNATEIDQWLSNVLAWKSHLEDTAQRDILVIEGSWNFSITLIGPLLELLPERLLISSQLHEGIPLKQASNCLGQQAPWVIVDLFDGFDADVFCIAAGLVSAGGVLVLLWPGLQNFDDTGKQRCAVWQDDKRSTFPWFEHYLFDSLQAVNAPGCWVTEDDLDGRLLVNAPKLRPTPIVEGCTEDQREFLLQARQWLKSSQTGVFLLLADRGRGKSTALGKLCDFLQQEGQQQVVVTAASRQAAAELLKQAPGARFVAPDVLLQTSPAADLVLIDESAMIPQSILRQICHRYSRCILATTTGGYEGTGQGFLLRFRTSFPGSRLRECVLHAPVRWCDGDQLEYWLNQTLLSLRDDQSALKNPDFDSHALTFRVLQPGEDLSLTRRAYALLSHAHYRTAPSDLQMMMENPDLRLLIVSDEEQLMAAALLNREGALPVELSEAIFFGKRRPRGHLLAQMITVQCGVADFACWRGLRIQRIAVSPDCRRRGIGTALLQQAQAIAENEGFDYLGASFALDAGAAEFWASNEFGAACLSHAQGKSSGSHSLAVIKPLNKELRLLGQQLIDKLCRQLPMLLLLSLQTMEASHVVAVLRYLDFKTVPDDLEVNDMRAFTQGERGLESCFASVQKQVMQVIAQSTGPVDELIVYKAVLNRDWSTLPRDSGSEGRRQLQQRLRLQVEALMKDC